jgi:hypothetical protein
MADKSPYADLGLTRMAGNYGPETKMRTAMAAFTPNIPWARFGCPDTVDRDGGGTSSATPQVAAAAALWLQKHKAALAAYPQKWMRVEAARHALFTTAVPHGNESAKFFGRGLLRAGDALAVGAQPAAALRREAPDDVSFPILQLLFGGGIAARPDDRQRMLEIEAVQLAARSHKIHEALQQAEAEGPPRALTAAVRNVLEALADDPNASRALRRAIDGRFGSRRRDGGASPSLAPALTAAGMASPKPVPEWRRLRVYAQDPLVGAKLEAFHLHETTLRVPWEPNLQPGPVGEYLEVIDIDPLNDSAYAPVDLGHPNLIGSDGLEPSERVPQFHQQMVYAVAMKTIGHFERALGRVALWAPRIIPPPWQKRKKGERREQRFVRRLRIYPHALQEANAYYSPEKKALLFGYFPEADGGGARGNRATIFTCLSHDIIAHETAHALLDGLHPRYTEASNQDMLAFHEAFADIVALLQHFTMPEALKDAIRKTRGDLTRENQLGALAWQFGQAIGSRGALRDAIGTYDERGVWKPHEPKPTDYNQTQEAHGRGAVLVAAIFDAFLQVYRHETASVLGLASEGTGIIRAGELPPLLVEALAQKAAGIADRLLDICVRALDYCPPIDMYFGEYLRAMVTADTDVNPDDRTYRVALIDAFRSRGIFPPDLTILSQSSLLWEPPESVSLPIQRLVKELDLPSSSITDRFDAFVWSRESARQIHAWLTSSDTSADDLRRLGLVAPGTIGDVAMGIAGHFSRIEVHSVRTAARMVAGRNVRVDLVVELTQKFVPSDRAAPFHRGGCTLLVDTDKCTVRYVIRKRVDSKARMAEQQAFKLGLAQRRPHRTYFGSDAGEAEPFAIAHRNL